MLASRKALLYHVNSFRHNHASRFMSSISHKNQQFQRTAAPPPEDLSRVNKTAAGEGEVDVTARGSGGAGETVKEAAVGGMETAVEVGKMGKRVVDGMVEAAENTADSLRDSLSDDSGSDKFVEDLRRRSAGYDIERRR